MAGKIIIGFCLIIFLVAWFGFPDIIKCPYKNLTGRPCLFCGTLTSLSLVVHGNIKGAWDTNPVGVFVFLICIFGIWFLIYFVRKVNF